jgi:hypothetical protein
MKNFTSSLVPVAILVLIGACATAVLGSLVVVLTSLGFGEWIPVLYYWQMNLPVLSVALPIVGMILFAMILFGISGKREEEVKLGVIESCVNQEVIGEGKKEEKAQKAA